MSSSELQTSPNHLENSQPKSGWEIFHTSQDDDPSPEHAWGNREVIASSSSSWMSSLDKATEESFISDHSYGSNERPSTASVCENHGMEDNAKKKDISSLFLANQFKTIEKTSLFQAHSNSLPSTTELQRPSTAMPRLCSRQKIVTNDGVILSAIFSLNKISYDVTMYEDSIKWEPISGKKQRSGFSPKKQAPLENGMIYLHEICSVKLKNIRNVESGTFTTVGFTLFTAMERSGSKMREKSIAFVCFSREICIQWASKIKNFIRQAARPRRLLVFSSGGISASQVWDDVVEPKLEMACVKSKYVELDQHDYVVTYVQNVLAEQSVGQGLELYDGILVIGKVSLFSSVLNAVVTYKARFNRSDAFQPRIVPVGFVPTSTSNFIASEIHGISDAETAVMHALYGCTRDMPICEFYDEDNQLLKYGLVGSYGFSGGDTVRESSSKGLAAMQGSIKRGIAITKAIVKRRSYPCEIQYKDMFHTESHYENDEYNVPMDFSKLSKTNDQFVEDEAENSGYSLLDDDEVLPDGDSGIWPHAEIWNKMSKDNYLDITVTSLPQLDESFPDRGPLSIILKRDSASRKDLFLGMGSQVSMNSVLNKHKMETQNKIEIVHGTEIIIKPIADSMMLMGSSSNNSAQNSSWTVDGCCLDTSIQELHVKVHQYPMVLYGRASGTPFSKPFSVDIWKLDDDTTVLESTA